MTVDLLTPPAVADRLRRLADLVREARIRDEERRDAAAIRSTTRERHCAQLRDRAARLARGMIPELHALGYGDAADAEIRRLP